MGPIGCLLLIISLGFTLGTSLLVMWFLSYDNPLLAIIFVLLIVLTAWFTITKALKDLKSGELRPEDYFDDDDDDDWGD